MARNMLKQSLVGKKEGVYLMSRLAFRLGIILGTFIAFAFTNADASLYASTNGRADSNITANLAMSLPSYCVVPMMTDLS